MLIRIVELPFQPENISSFEALLQKNKAGIVSFDGYQQIALCQDQKFNCILASGININKKAH